MPPTSYLVSAHAHVALAFLRDRALSGGLDLTQPALLLEAGVGSGPFGYALQRHLTALLESSPVAGLSIKLVLLEPDEALRARWKTHRRLSHLIAAGSFDLADPGRGGARLEISGEALPFLNPIIAVAASVEDLKGLPYFAGSQDDAVRLLALFRAPIQREMLERFATETGGTGLVTGNQSGLYLLPAANPADVLFSLGPALEDAAAADFEAFPADGPITIPQYLDLLRSSNYDATVACAHVDSVAPLIGEAEELPASLKEQLSTALRRVWASYLDAGHGQDVALSLAWLATGLRDLEFAFELLDASLSVRGECGELAFLLALAYYHREEFRALDLASESVEWALKLEPDQEEYLWLREAIANKRREMAAAQYDSLLDKLAGRDPSDPVYRETAAILNPFIAHKGYPRPEPDPGPPKRLTIGMATYDDFDGVYFSVMALRMYHPEIAGQTEILVVDNQPEGRAAEPLKELAKWVKGYRYIAAPRPGGTAARDLVFRHANAEFVLCMDSHVFFEPGSLAALLDYFEANPNTRDLLQGPCVYDDLTTVWTHWDPVWDKGMFGKWGKDPRGLDRAARPFEIPMQGLGIFACRRDAWLGFNPRFRGFGGEEGYIHEKFRQAGAAVLCLPFLRWIHRFTRNIGPSYLPTNADKVRNYLLGWLEMGQDPGPVVRHFETLLGAGEAAKIVGPVQMELANPFLYFDGIYFIDRDCHEERRANAIGQFRKMGIERLVLRFPVVQTPHSPPGRAEGGAGRQIGRALSHRAVIAEAKRRALRSVVIFEDDVIFAPGTLEVLGERLTELQRQKKPWQVMFLGEILQRESFDKPPGNEHREMTSVTGIQAWAVSDAAYDLILRDMPDTPAAMALWLRDRWVRFDEYLMDGFSGSSLLVSPAVTVQASGSVAGGPFVEEREIPSRAAPVSPGAIAWAPSAVTHPRLYLPDLASVRESLNFAKTLPDTDEPLDFHFYWRVGWPFGPKPLLALKSFVDVHGDRATYHLWSNVDLSSQVPDRVRCHRYDARAELAGTPWEGLIQPVEDTLCWLDSDLFRCLILWKYGGIYCDMDVCCLRSFGPLAGKEFLYQWCWSGPHHPPLQANGAVMALLRGSPSATILLDILAGMPPAKDSNAWGAKSYARLLERDPRFAVLPCAWFDTEWVRSADNRHGQTKWPKPPMMLHQHSAEFWDGAFAWHWHNAWEMEVEEGSKFALLAARHGIALELARQTE